jgi:Holliday junction resolvase-like predicted endonuclease
MKKPNYRNVEGKRCELIAVDWLLSQGCYTYTQTMEQGPIDIVALSPKGEWFFFDVKKASRREDGSIISRVLETKQKKLGVRLLYVDIDTNECHLYPHQFNVKQTSIQNAGNRQFKGVKPAAISSLLHLESPPQD